MTNENGVKRACSNKQLDAWKYSLKTSDLSLPSVFSPPKQKIKFAVNMS